VLKTIGREVPDAKPPAANVGGPYLPLAGATDPALFISRLDWVSGEIERYTAIHYLAVHLPVSTPLPDPSVTSGFGTRIDPFLGTPALHPGIDYRASLGTPVAATAPGTVIDTQTGYNGGYGNMVDIDHGNGIVTRFAHLSEIAVKVGQVVAKGTTIGKAGSTGRATGPHLHYEVRVNDEAVDPTRFISVGEKLLPLL
jgi:murein DD-endopeptidase MepM/ murein hydrolase activator NlpD